MADNARHGLISTGRRKSCDMMADNARHGLISTGRRKSCDMMADNARHGLISTERRKSSFHSTINCSYVAGKMCENSDTALPLHSD
jgi:hypothetical protein